MVKVQQEVKIIAWSQSFYFKETMLMSGVILRLLSLSIVFLFILSGCASVQMGDPGKDASLKKFAIAPDKAGIFIYRNEILALAIKMNVAIDGTPLGQTAAKTYLYTPVAPGKHVITSYAENTDMLEVDIKAGTLVYVWQEVKIGVGAKLHLMDEEEGQKGVLETKLAQNFPATQDIEVLVKAEDPAWKGPLECPAQPILLESGNLLLQVL